MHSLMISSNPHPHISAEATNSRMAVLRRLELGMLASTIFRMASAMNMVSTTYNVETAMQGTRCWN